MLFLKYVNFKVNQEGKGEIFGSQYYLLSEYDYFQNYYVVYILGDVSGF